MSTTANRTLHAALLEFVNMTASEGDFAPGTVPTGRLAACRELSRRLAAGLPTRFVIGLTKMGDADVFRFVFSGAISQARTERTAWFLSEAKRNDEGEWSHFATAPYDLTTGRFVGDDELDDAPVLPEGASVTLSATVARQILQELDLLEVVAARDIFTDAPECAAAVGGLQDVVGRLASFKASLHTAIASAAA